MNIYLQCTCCEKKVINPSIDLSLAHSLVCLQFNNRIESFYDLSLDILDHSTYSLEDSIRKYFSEEFIDGKPVSHRPPASSLSAYLHKLQH